MKGGAAVAADSWRVCLCLVVDLLFMAMGPIAGETLCANTNRGLNAVNEVWLSRRVIAHRMERRFRERLSMGGRRRRRRPTVGSGAWSDGNELLGNGWAVLPDSAGTTVTHKGCAYPVGDLAYLASQRACWNTVPICIAAFDDALGGAPSLAGLGSIPPAQRDAAPDAMLPAGAGGARSAPGDAKSNVEITPVEVNMAS